MSPAESSPSWMLPAVQHDSWLDVGGILSYPAADPCIARSVQTCVGTYYGLENGSWMTGSVRRHLAPQPLCEEDSHGLAAQSCPSQDPGSRKNGTILCRGA